jgi:hypothetical protein
MFLSLVFFIEITAVYLAVIYWRRAARAGQSGAAWGLGAGIGYSAVLWVLVWILTLLPLPDYLQIQLAFVVWFALTLATGIRTDSVFDSKLAVSG